MESKPFVFIGFYNREHSKLLDNEGEQELSIESTLVWLDFGETLHL